MLAKRRLFGALLFMLTLLSSAACAKLNLKPYEVPSASGTEVEILAPEVYLLLHDSPLNGGKLKTALVLRDHGQTVFEQRLPDHTADSENLSYRLFVADANLCSASIWRKFTSAAIILVGLALYASTMSVLDSV